MSLIVRPTRLDHFPKAQDLIKWLEDHGLPVSKNNENNINTMLRATGGKV